MQNTVMVEISQSEKPLLPSIFAQIRNLFGKILILQIFLVHSEENIQLIKGEIAVREKLFLCVTVLVLVNLK